MFYEKSQKNSLILWRLIVSFLSKLNIFLKNYLWSETEKKLFTLFEKKSLKFINKDADLVLIQCVEDYYYYSLFGQILTDLRKIKNIQAEQYILRNFSVASYRSVYKFLVRKVSVNHLSDKKWTRLYGAYCDRIAYSNEQSLGYFNDFNVFIKAKKIAKRLTSKEELILLKIDDIQIGDLIYDTYLRFKPAPTVNLNDFYLVIVIWKALRNIQITKRYFTKNNPKILLQSYSTYIQHGITARIALLNGTDVYTFGNYQVMAKKLSLNDYHHVVYTAQYKNEFEILEGKDIKRSEAECALQCRLDGNIDLVTAYMKESAYKESEYNLPDVHDAVVVFLHNFYDSPHVYRSMVFADFLDWIKFTINALEKESVTYYLKPHPDQSVDSSDVVTELCKKYPTIKLLSPKITNKQLVISGIKLGITVYGTIAHELVFMGVPVITCGDNPHSSYNFCFEAKSKKQYSYFIKNIDDLTYSNKDEMKNEVKSFYYMHSLNLSDDEKILTKDLGLLRKHCEILEHETNYQAFQNVLDKIENNISYIEFIKNL